MASTKECKAELHGHSHVVECVSWAPDSALPYVNEVVNSEVSIMIQYQYCISIYIIYIYIYIYNLYTLCICHVNLKDS